MPTENRSNDADGWIACDDGLHLIQMDKNLSHYGWVFRKVDGGLPYSVREATAHEMAHAQARQHLRIGVAQIAGQAPAPLPHPEPARYPPCDYCRTVPSYHPWHGSGMLNGVENRHIHACDGCRGQLPSHPGQPHPEPIAWMVGTAIWWTKEEAERDAAETGLPMTPVGPLTGSAEVEQLREVIKHSDSNIQRQSLRISNQRAQLAERDALLTKMKALFRVDDPFDLYDAVCAVLSARAEPSEPTPQAVNGHRLCCKAVDDYRPGKCSCGVEIDHEIPGTSFQRLNALANQGE